MIYNMSQNFHIDDTVIKIISKKYPEEKIPQELQLNKSYTGKCWERESKDILGRVYIFKLIKVFLNSVPFE